jgi:hypothetical protein
MLQRITENVSYCDLLHKAAEAADPVKRLEYISAFAVSTVSSNVNRYSKPFNPLLGETYELIREDIGFKIICEQVSHHPPISAFHTESIKNNDWEFYGFINPKIKFWGKSVEIYPKGKLTLKLKKYNETYSWQQVTCCVHNIIIGKLWFEYYGTMEISCQENGYKSVLNFKPYSWFNKELNRVDGFIYDKSKNKKKALYGYWTHCMYSCNPNEFDEYVRSDKQLPMVKLDENFNEVEASYKGSTSSSLSENFQNQHSFSDLLRLVHSNNTDSLKKASFNLNNQEKIEFNLDLDEKQDELSVMSENENNEENENLKKSVSVKNLHTNLSSISLPSDYYIMQQLELFEIWRASPRPFNSSDYYSFNYFTMSLNELKEEYKLILPPTDSRYRTDVRELELGNLDRASEEKLRLEEKQREAAKQRKDDYIPKWFDYSKDLKTSEESWTFNKKYWLRNFTDCPDLY